MAKRRDSWPDAVVQAVDRIFRIRHEVRQLEKEETSLRDSVLAALAGVREVDFPLHLGGHDVRVQVRSGRIDDQRAVDRMTELGLAGRLPIKPNIVDPVLLADFEHDLATVAMSNRSRARLKASYAAAVSHRAHLDGDTLRSWREQRLISDDDYQTCFHDGKSTIRILIVR